jgi:serine/threonine protein kinase
MEYVHGGEIYSRIKNEIRLPAYDVKFYAVELISVLEYLHDMNIVYRDLKPENLMIDRTGHLKLVDFGFAKVVNGRTYTH